MIHFKRIKRLRTFRTAWKKVNPLFGQIFTLSLSLSLSLISFSSYYRVYQGFRQNLVIGSRMIILVSLLTTFNVSNNFCDDLVIAWNWFKPKIRPSKPSLAFPTPWYTRYNSIEDYYFFSQTFPKTKTVCTHICEGGVNRDAQPGPGLKLQVVDLERFRGPQVELGYAHGHQAPQVFQGFDKTNINVWIICDTAL